MIRCLVCGSSESDRKGMMACGLCGKAMGLRSEECYVSEATKAKLLAHADDLSKFGIQVNQYDRLAKWTMPDHTVDALALVITCADSLHHGALRKVVCYFKDRLSIPEEDVLGLRLDEPKKILTYYRMDKKTERQMIE